MSRIVLDAPAILALLQGEDGADMVAEALPDASVSAVNHAEVAARLADEQIPDAAIAAALNDLGLEVTPFDTAQALAPRGFARRT